jgi:hypothetical protein
MIPLLFTQDTRSRCAQSVGLGQSFNIGLFLEIGTCKMMSCSVDFCCMPNKGKKAKLLPEGSVELPFTQITCLVHHLSL